MMREYLRTITSPYEVGPALYRITDRAAAVVPADGAGIILAPAPGEEPAFVAATDGRVLRVEQQQLQHRSGPCYEAYDSGEVRISEDLATEDRWPGYREATADAGLRSVLAVPLRTADRHLGALNLYRTTPGPWHGDERRRGALMGDMIVGLVLLDRERDEARTVTTQLQRALDSRVVIEQAKGALASRHRIEMEAAFDLLRTTARSQRRRLHDVAADVVAGVLTRDRGAR